MITFTRLGSDLSNADVIAFEQKLGFNFPEQYRDFLLLYNGGVPEIYPTTFEVVGDSTLKRYLEVELFANELERQSNTPLGFVWHHAEDGETFQLVPFDIHLITGRHKSISEYQYWVGEKKSLFDHRQEQMQYKAIHGSFNTYHNTIQMFFCINAPTTYANLGWYKDVLGSRIPSDLLPIACDGSGNLICLALSGLDFGAVYFWEWYSEDTPPSYKNLFLVAATFQQFFLNIGSTV